jgi:hypothetical protein
VNIYRHTFTGPCPNNQRSIDYRLEIRANRVLMAEDIVSVCEEMKTAGKPYHETIADRLYERFAGKQRLIAFHHGVEIETVRG